MSNGTLEVAVVTPTRLVLEEECDAVSLPAALGYVTILPRHAPLVSTLGTGVLTLRRRGARIASAALSGGFFEVSDDVVTVLADEARLPDQIDAAEARRELEEARASLGSVAGAELRQARLRIERAEAQLEVAAEA